MSIDEEDPSLKDLVTKTLQSSGVLGKIQAQLRASVFLALEDGFNNKNIPLVNKESSKLLSSVEGSLCAALVYDFLQCLELEFTQSVFAPESGMTSSWSLKERQSLASDLDLKNASAVKTPLLYQLIKSWQSVGKNNNNQRKEQHGKQEEFATLSSSFITQDKLPSLPMSNAKHTSLPPLSGGLYPSTSLENVELHKTLSNESLSDKSNKVNKDTTGNIFTTEKLLEKSESSEEKSISKNLKQKLVKELAKSDSIGEGSSFSNSDDESCNPSKTVADTEQNYDDDFSASENHEPDKEQTDDGQSEQNPSDSKDDENSETRTKSNDAIDSADEVSEDIEELLNSTSLDSDGTQDLSIATANNLVNYQEDL